LATSIGANIMPFVEKRMLKGGDYTYLQHATSTSTKANALSLQGESSRAAILTGERMTLTEYSKVAGRSTLTHSSVNESHTFMPTSNQHNNSRYLTALSNPNGD